MLDKNTGGQVILCNLVSRETLGTKLIAVTNFLARARARDHVNCENALSSIKLFKILVFRSMRFKITILIREISRVYL